MATILEIALVQVDTHGTTTADETVIGAVTGAIEVFASARRTTSRGRESVLQGHDVALVRHLEPTHALAAPLLPLPLPLPLLVVGKKNIDNFRGRWLNTTAVVRLTACSADKILYVSYRVHSTRIYL